MKFLNAFIELITSPITYLLKKAGGKNSLFPLGKALIVLLIAIVIVTGLVLLVYKDLIFISK